MATYDELIRQANNYVSNYNPNEQVNMNDSRLTNIEKQRGNALTNTTNTYNNMINSTNQYYDNLDKVQREYANQQQELQNANTEQSIKEINQQREKTQRDYQREQRGAYTDYQKQVNEYGINAEVMAAKGLTNTGYAESSKVSMYNAYQNRVAIARQSLQDSMLSYDNMIAQARLNNSTQLAEIAYNLAKSQAENALNSFQYKNTLIESRENRLDTINNRYDARYNTMLGQLNQEIQNKQNMFSKYSGLIQNDKEMQEQKAQFEREMTMKQQQFDREMAMKQQQLEEQRRQYNADLEYRQQQLQYQREQSDIAQRQWQEEYDLKVRQYEASLRSGSGGR